MANPFDQFDFLVAANPFDQFDRHEANPFDQFDTDGSANGADISMSEFPNEFADNSGRTLGGTIKDAGISLYKGVVGLEDAAVGLVDMVTPGNLGGAYESGMKWLTGTTPKEAVTYAESQYSDAQKEANRKVNEAEGFLPTTGALLKNPSVVAHSLVESAPSMLAAGGIGRGLVLVEGAASPVLASAAGEGLISSGSTHEQIRQGSPSGNVTPMQSNAAALSGFTTGTLTMIGGRLANRLGFGDIDTMLASGSREVAGKGGVKEVARRIIGGGISEGFFEEMPQSAQERIWLNAATGRPLLDGVPADSAQGLVVGVAMGTGTNTVARPTKTQSHVPSDKILDANSVDQVISEFEADGMSADSASEAALSQQQPKGMLSKAPELYRAMYEEAGRRYGVDPELLAAQGFAESGFDPDAVSPAGARGIAQFMPATAQEYGIDPMNPVEAIDGQARYMAKMLERYDGDVSKALAAYNAGPGRVDDGSWQSIGETQTYVDRILGELGQESGPMAAEWAAQQQAAPEYNQARNKPQLDESIQFAGPAIEEVAQEPVAPPVEEDAPLEAAPQPVSGEQIAQNESQPDLSLTGEPQQRLVPDVPVEQIGTVDNGDGSFSLIHKATGESIIDGQTYSSRKEARAAFVQERNAARANMFSIAPDRSAAIARNDDGSLSLGEIGQEKATVMRQQAGSIRLNQGNHDDATGRGSGITHIEARHGAEIRQAGYNSAEHFVADVVENHNEIRRGGAGSLLLIKKNGADKVSVVRLSPDARGDFYNVETAYLSRSTHKKELLWSAAQSRSPVPGGQSAFAREPVTTSGQTTPNALPISDVNTVPTEKGNVNIEAEIGSQLGTGRAKLLLANGKVQILETQQDAENVIKDLDATPKRSEDGKIQGFTTPDGKVHLVRDGIQKGNAMGVLAHEMGVHAKRLGFKKDAEWQGIVKSIERRSTSNGRSGQAIRAAQERIPKDTAPEHVQEELVAYLVEHHANDKIPLVDRIIAHIKKWLYQAGIMHADRLSPKDLAVFARAAIRDEARMVSGISKPTSQTVSGKASRFMASMAENLGVTAEQLQREYDAVVKRYKGTDQWLKAPNGKDSNLNERQWVQVRTESFKKWFGDWENDSDNASKVVDANGEPLVVYHATNEDFSEFSREILGGSTGKNTDAKRALSMAKVGFWFSARDVSKNMGSSAVMPVFLNIRQPLKTTFEKMWNGGRGRSGQDGYIVDDSEFNAVSYVALSPTQIKSATGNTGAFDASNQDIRYSRAAQAEAEEALDQDLKDIAEQAPKKLDIRAFTPFAVTAEYTLSKIAAGRRALEAVARRQERRFMLQGQILDGETQGMSQVERQQARDNGFVNTFKKLKKDAPKSYANVQRYLLEIDRTGRGFHLSHESGYVVTTPDGNFIGLAKTREEALTKARDHVRDNGLKGKVLIKDYGTEKGFIWTAHKPNKAEIGTFTNEQEAVGAMIKGEQAELLKRGFSEQEAAAVQVFREMTNRAFDLHAEGAREVIRRCEEEGIDPPMVEGIDETRRWAVRGKSGKNIATFESREKAQDMLRQLLSTHPRYANANIVRQTDGEIKKMFSLHDAIAQMGDMRGTYFPRQREHGGMGLRAINEQTGEKIFLKGDAYLARLDPEEKKGFVAQKADALRKLFNSGTPLGRQARKLRRQGFVISFERDTTMPEDVFSAKQLSTNIAALMDEGMQRVDKSSMTPAEVAAYISMHRAVTDQLAGIIKQRGFLSSRMKRSENYWQGFEEDPLKAGTAYANGLAGGVAKRQLAQDLTMIIAGRDITWKQWKEENPKGDWPEYTEFVNNRKIDPVKQKNIYGETMSWAGETLRNQEAADRLIGTLKGLAVFKYMAFRIPSAAVNLTNLGLGVPATISSHTGLSITRSTAQINRSLKTMVDYKRGKASALDAKILTEISERGWDNPQFNHDAAAVLRSRFGNAWQGVVDAGMWLFGQAEVVNRRATIHAAYKMWSRANPELTHEELMQKAHHASDRAHGWYGQETAPKWTRGAANPLKAVWTFQKFGQNYLLNIGEMIGKGDYKQAAYMLLAPVILGGPKATLVTPLLVALAKGLGIGGDDPEEELYKWARDTFGSDSWMRFGAPGLLGISFQGSLAMGIPVVSDVLEKGKRLNSLAELFGAPGSVVYDIYSAGGSLSKGEYAKAAEKALPSAFGSMVKAARESTEGVTTENYGSVYYGSDLLKVSGMETYLRALSFAPAGITAKRQEQWSERKIKDKYAEMRADINREIKRIFVQNDGYLPEEEFAKILPRIDRYNDAVAGLNRPDISFITGRSIRTMLKGNAKPSKLERMRAMEMFEETEE